MFYIGNGIDIHKLENKKEMIKQNIGGIEIETQYKIIAHSDGDIVIHSIIDAILGAMCKGDIGEYFSDKDQKNKNLNSSYMLDKIILMMENEKYKIHNIDITFISEHIYISSYKKQIKDNLKKLLKCDHISFKATRWEEDKKMVQVNTSILLKKEN